ncbi:SUKH-4 family immunity protein [Gorillibacterium sp. CAU 1737]|uniref:SUKH-4 family immunity protein n=1 Tax=Gorillibacterium sp. CAU 1737 TaxID=3140362 RepID=UPI003260B077
MGPEQYVSKWKEMQGEELMRFHEDSLQDVTLDQETKRFLTEAGLPGSAAPGLDFNTFFESVAEWGGWDESLHHYHRFGSTGWGDPICLDETDGSVVHLDHEKDGKRRTFINSSLLQFAEFLLSYRQFIKETLDENGEDAYMDNNIPERLMKWIAEEFERIDPAACRKGAFWATELRNLEEEA